MKLTLNLSLLLAVVMAVVLVFFEGVALRRESALLEQDIRRDARLIAEALAHMAARIAADAETGEGTAAGVADLFGSVARAEDEVRIAWRAADGHDAPALPQEARARLAQGEQVLLEVALDGQATILAWVPVQVGATPLGVVEVAESLARRDDFLWRGQLTAAMLILGITVLSGATGLLAGRAFVGDRIAQLIQKTQQVAQGELDIPAQLRGNDELNTLAQALNQMADDLGRLRRYAEEEANARLQAEVALQHADRLKTVGLLAAGIAHELGTPLNVIAGRAALLERRAGDNERIRADARTVREQADRITRFVRLLMDHARHTSPQVSAFDLVALAKDQLELLAPQARQHHITIALHTPTADRVPVVADRDQIAQVLTNLLLNAVQASPPDSRVTLSLSPAPTNSGGQEEEEGAVIEVQDQGPGIAPEAREAIFEPFYTTKAPGEGTGLGLSIVRRILRAHGARLTISDPPEGRGALFAVYLPPRAAP